MARSSAAVAAVETTRGWPYAFEVVELKLMFVDDAYQRPLTSFVERIKRNYDPALIGTLVLSARSKTRHAIVDGQTRWAAMSSPEVGETHGPCLVYRGLSQQQEASLFAKLQKERRGIASFHRFRAALVAGEDEPIAIDRIVRECGYEVGLSGANSKAISAVAALETSYRRGPDILERALSILYTAWKDRHVPSGEILRGLSLFLDRNQDVDDEKLAMRVMLVTPAELKRRASALREGAGHGGGSDRYMAGVFEAIYNTRTNPTPK